MTGGQTNRAVGLWLMAGVLMVFVQVVLGGITRLTGSGLSITEWNVVMGAIPPVDATAWQVEFEKYRQSPQYKKLNRGMKLHEFKTIYWWEYLHRLWARLMGFVFIIPFFTFLFQKKLDRLLFQRLGIVIALAALVASFGWIMVKSGLVDRPWVDPYKLTGHLSLALVLYGYLFWLALSVLLPRPVGSAPAGHRWWAVGITLLICLQLMVGGLMSGMKAGLFYPTFPDMKGEWVPSMLLSLENWDLAAFRKYDTQLFAVTAVQFVHRLLAWLIVVTSTIDRPVELSIAVATAATNQCFLFDINGLGAGGTGRSIIVGPAGDVLHQAGALLLLTAVLFVDYCLFRSAGSYKLN